MSSSSSFGSNFVVSLTTTIHIKFTASLNFSLTRILFTGISKYELHTSLKLTKPLKELFMIYVEIFRVLLNPVSVRNEATFQSKASNSKWEAAECELSAVNIFSHAARSKVKLPCLI